MANSQRRSRVKMQTPDPKANNDQTPGMSLYEQSRAERIKENLEKMQKLGIMDLSLKLKSPNAPKRITPRNNNPSATKQASTLKLPGPLRRSSRLQNAMPVSYSEVVLTKKEGSWEEAKLVRGSKPEVYTEEDEKLLGNTERSWTLFVDGYGKDGRRIYDPINGKTCHQCRQKTLGYRTHCNKCNLVQGQFCGDCLYMRYGEHVLEALEDPNWICPVCRGICNCSLCRQGKGWPATGPLYRKISSMGYKSVAHYLIQTRRSQNNLGRELVPVSQVSSKRSLSFSDMEVLSNEAPLVNSEQIVLSLDFKSEDKLQDELKNEKEHMPSIGNLATGQTRRSLLCAQVKLEEVDVNIAPEKPKRKHLVAVEESLDSIATRLKQMRRESNNHHDAGLTQESKINSVVKQAANDSLFSEEEKKAKELQTENVMQDLSMILMPAETSGKRKKKSARTADPSPDSIGGRLRLRRRMIRGQDDDDLSWKNEQSSDVGQASNSISSEEIVEVSMKLTSAEEPCEDSIVD